MIQRMENVMDFIVQGIDITGATNLEFYIKQPNTGNFFQYTPTIVDESHIRVIMPFSDAVELTSGSVDCQLALTTADGLKTATEIATIEVSALLKESGYD